MNPFASANPTCEGADLQLNASGGSTYSWEGPGGYTSSLQNPVRTPATPAMSGIYTVTITSAVGGCTEVVAVNATISSQPAAATGDPVLCEGETINLSASDGGSSYSWQGPNGFTSASQNPVLNNATPAMSGTYTVTITGTGGCSGTSSVTVTVNALPVATAGSNSPICNGSTIALTSSGGNQLCMVRA
jgi:hypothetical protein